MLEKVFLVAMVVLALLAVQTAKVRRAVVYLGAFSLISSFAYIFYGAPDVAMAEAIIGSTLATVLFLIALKKYRVFTICIIHEIDQEFDDSHISKSRYQILDDIEGFLVSHELEPQTVYTTEGINDVLNKYDYDMVIHQQDNSIVIYGGTENYQFDQLRDFLSHYKYNSLNLSIVIPQEGMDNDA